MKSPFLDHTTDEKGEIIAHTDTSPRPRTGETKQFYDDLEGAELALMDAQTAVSVYLEENPTNSGTYDRETHKMLNQKVTEAKNAVKSF